MGKVGVIREEKWKSKPEQAILPLSIAYYAQVLLMGQAIAL